VKQLALYATFFAVITACSAQTNVQQAENLATCLSGRYPSLCHKAWLSPTDQQKAGNGGAQGESQDMLIG
jgi:hypothetical protein